MEHVRQISECRKSRFDFFQRAGKRTFWAYWSLHYSNHSKFCNLFFTFVFDARYCYNNGELVQVPRGGGLSTHQLIPPLTLKRIPKTASFVTSCREVWSLCHVHTCALAFFAQKRYWQQLFTQPPRTTFFNCLFQIRKCPICRTQINRAVRVLEP